MSDGIRFAWAIAAAVSALGSWSSFAIGNSRVPDDYAERNHWAVTASPAQPDDVGLIEPVTIACTTDADCYAKNPHVLEDPDAELPTLMDDALGALGYEPCVAEDGPGPCYWNAEVRGNGTGDSFVIDSLGGVVYLYD